MRLGWWRVTLAAIGLEVMWAALFASVLAGMFVPTGSRGTLWVLSMSAWLLLWTSPWALLIALLAAHVARRDGNSHVHSPFLIVGIWPTALVLFVFGSGGFLGFTGLWALPLASLVVIAAAIVLDLSRARQTPGHQQGGVRGQRGGVSI